MAGRDLIAFVHPHDGVGLEAVGGWGHILPVGLGFVFETTVALARMALGGVPRRHPDLVVLGAHSGGTIPFDAR